MKKEKEPKSLWEKFEQFWKKRGKYFFPLLLVIILFSLLFNSGNKAEQKLEYNEFIKAAQERKIDKIVIESQTTGLYKIKGSFIGTRNPDDSIAKGKNFILIIRKEAKFENLELENFFKKYDIKFTVKGKGSGSSLLGLLFYLFIFFVIAFIFLRPTMKSMKEQEKYLNKYTKSSAKLDKQKTSSKIVSKKITFKDVAGLKEAKEELKETIDFLKNPINFSKLGGRVPRGVLLVGPPGTGKTLLAKAVAGESSANFIYSSGSEFVEMFVGVGASRVRSLFARAKANTPAIIFIDELDALARHRGAGLGGGHDEREQTLNQLLVELDGFDERENVILLAATNRPDILDNALLRPGRFDRKVYTNLPDIEDREAILKVHTRNKPLANNADLKIIARGTPGFSGADLENLVNEAALKAAREKKEKIEMDDIEWAFDKLLMGAEKKIIITSKEKQTTAYHEAGHALTSLFCPEADPLHKVSIIPRGQALGITVQLPLKDKYLYSKEELEAKLIVLMGGRAAEEIFLDQLTTGASNDLEVATKLARKMVCNFGMSTELGPLSFGQKEGELFLGKDLRQIRNYSEDTAKKIDETIKNLIDEVYQKAKNILEKNKDKMEKLVKLLLEKETLTAEVIKKVL